jgi:dipeptidyl aminopeptidase/acylaminoacyl peptidase
MPTMCPTLQWLPDSRIAAVLQPEGFRRPDPRPETAKSPRVQISDSKANRIRTYASLLQTPEDQRILEAYATGQLSVIQPSGKIEKIGKPMMWKSISVSANGKFVHGTVMEKPFSYLVPVGSFGDREIVLDASGKELKELNKRPLRLGEFDPNAAPTTPTRPTPPPDPDPSGDFDISARSERDSFFDYWVEAFAIEQAPTRGGQRPVGAQGAAPGQTEPLNTGRRSLAWHPSEEALTFLQLSEEDANKKRTDRLLLWKPPFDDKSTTVVYETPGRISSARFGASANDLFVTYSNEGRTRTDYIRFSSGATTTLIGGGTADANNPAGTLVNAGDRVRMSRDGKSAFLSGTTRANDTSVTYFDKVNLADGKRERMFDGSGNETVRMLNDTEGTFLATRESQTTPANNFTVTQADKQGAKLTDNKDFVSDLSQAKRETITVTRNDGKTFRVIVTMMEGAYRRPAFFWFYPREYTDQSAYNRTLGGGGNRASNSFRQVGGSNKAILLRAGYVLVEPDCPIFGPQGRQNDSYIPQLRNNLSAVIDELHERGWVDRKRLALGGHSYGAFSTVNAMVHTPFFKCGIAGDGNYNRLLTPYGFQSEQRMLWDGREMYLSMSPLLYAEQLTGALLMYHGEADQNVGTALINSERLFGALEALGKPSALYVYPYEDHGQIARETILDQWARWIDWLDKHLK